MQIPEIYSSMTPGELAKTVCSLIDDNKSLKKELAEILATDESKAEANAQLLRSLDTARSTIARKIADIDVMRAKFDITVEEMVRQINIKVAIIEGYKLRAHQDKEKIDDLREALLKTEAELNEAESR